MKTAIIFYSQHHKNTGKLVDAIKGADPEVKLIGGLQKGHPTVLYVSHRRYLDKYVDQVVEV